MKANLPLEILDANRNIFITDKEGKLIADIVSKPKAEFIVRACNSHYELRESLEDIVKFVCEINPFCLINPKVENAIKILGKAEGK